MYEPETILTLKEPRSQYDDDGEPVKLFPYDRVKVIGPSPINHGITSEEWVGANGQGVIITPLTDFGGTADEPLGKLQALYDVESVPERTAPVAAPIKVVTPGTAGPTPEDVFAKEAPGEASKHGERVRTPRSPLDAEDPAEQAEIEATAKAIRERQVGGQS